MENAYSYHKELEENVYRNPNELEIMWRKEKGGVQILRVYGNTMEVLLPEKVEGLPVTEIGAYCFSSSEHLPDAGYFISRGFAHNPYFSQRDDSESEECPERRIEKVTMPSISGKYVESVILPSTITILHNAAFYNCRGLKSLSVGSRIQAIGSDVFMNCIKLEHLIVRGKAEEKSGLSLILERLTTDVEVDFPGKCTLFFPEYYEWLNEISAAHIFSRSIEGEGFRMRHAFTDQKLDFTKYDSCFSSVLARETDRTICRIALDRLRSPIALSQDAASIYEKAIRERFSQALASIVKNRDFSSLQFMCDYFKPEAEDLSRWMELCIREDWSEGNVYLMDLRRKNSSFAKKTFDFDDF